MSVYGSGLFCAVEQHNGTNFNIDIIFRKHTEKGKSTAINLFCDSITSLSGDLKREEGESGL